MYDVKHDGRHKSRLLANGHLTDITVEIVYYGVVSLTGIWFLVFLDNLNKTEMWDTDIGNAYLKAKTLEKAYIIAGNEFGDREGQILIFAKALYGLWYSILRRHSRFYSFLRDMGFFMCKLESEIWLRKNGDIYEYIDVYVNLLSIAARDSKNLMDAFENKYKFKIPLDFISYMTLMVFYDFPHTNIMTRWSRTIWLFLVQIQRYTSM